MYPNNNYEIDLNSLNNMGQANVLREFNLNIKGLREPTKQCIIYVTLKFEKVKLFSYRKSFNFAEQKFYALRLDWTGKSNILTR